jgi:hypothetical protein
VARPLGQRCQGTVAGRRGTAALQKQGIQSARSAKSIYQVWCPKRPHTHACIHPMTHQCAVLPLKPACKPQVNMNKLRAGSMRSGLKPRDSNQAIASAAADLTPCQKACSAAGQHKYASHRAQHTMKWPQREKVDECKCHARRQKTVSVALPDR